MASESNFDGPPVDTGAVNPADPGSLLAIPTDAAGAQRLNEGAKQFKALAQSGGFSINEAGFRAYEKICHEFLDGYSGMNLELAFLRKPAKMGSSDYSVQVANFNTQIADGEPVDQALIPNMNLLKEGFEKILEALKIARKNYRETEDAHQQVFAKGLGEGS
ncbi:hypothetical protein [Amycolatopsis jiangsuensis]|uniref:Uncharacterized protein n=1 Tax=Amycolatopsis jiangsuensis TaxID=1181879 RepID=A0A840J3V1_9PSEU|nr:hypothetical protein [Amycolatopsis jiangsuensis]MBB4687994.1 hypothetical protein [Amycolatopsis jiangsuensis]